MSLPCYVGQAVVLHAYTVVVFGRIHREFLRQTGKQGDDVRFQIWRAVKSAAAYEKAAL